MNNMYVLDITDNLDNLENDYTAWMNLPYDFRMRSNDECIRVHGMTNFELYQKLKSDIMNKGSQEDKIISNVSENAEEDDDSKNLINQVLQIITPKKIELSKEYNSSPLYAIIYPRMSEDIDEVYNKYLMLMHKYKIFSML